MLVDVNHVEMTKKKSYKLQYVLAGLLLAFVLLSCIIYYWDYDSLVKSTSNGGAWVISEPINFFKSLMDNHQKKFNPAGSALAFFNVSDGLSVKWYHGTNSLAQLEEALQGDYMMLEGDIILRWQGLPNQTDEPVMAHPPAVNSDNTLDNWLNKILARRDKGLKLDFKGLDVVRPSLELLRSKKDLVDHPVWANADVVQGTGIGTPIDAQGFLSLVNELWPEMTLSLGWTTRCCIPFTRPMMEAMWEVVQDTTQPVTFPARAVSFKESWPHFKWLLEKDLQRFTITVWTPSGADRWEGADIYDLLYVRNDCNKSLIYYDLPGQKFEDFKQLCVTGGSLFNHFPLEKRDGLDVTWAHAVNSQQELTDALQSDIMMLEADVLLRGQGTPNQTDVPIMAHPPAIDSDITLEEWLNRVLNHPMHKGIKLDFKSIDVLEPAMKVLENVRPLLKQPVWLNADIFRGPNSLSQGVNATEFQKIVGTNFPQSTWSLGWTTGWTNTALDKVYSKEMVDEMAEYARALKQPITFPVRAVMVKESWPLLKSLLDESRGYTLTIWSSARDNLNPEDMVYVRQNYEIDRIFYDLPEDQMNAFLERLNKTTTFPRQ